MSDGAATLRRLLATVFGIGFAPVLPGTAASLAAVLAAVAIPAPAYARTALFVVIATSFGCVVVGHFAGRDFGHHDPPEFVLDEVAGTFLAVLRVEKPGLLEFAAAFLLFRAFDVSKPFPLRQAERLPRGVGILLDDLLAGGYTLAILVIIRNVPRLLPA